MFLINLKNLLKMQFQMPIFFCPPTGQLLSMQRILLGKYPQWLITQCYIFHFIDIDTRKRFMTNPATIHYQMVVTLFYLYKISDYIPCRVWNIERRWSIYKPICDTCTLMQFEHLCPCGFMSVRTYVCTFDGKQ